MKYKAMFCELCGRELDWNTTEKEWHDHETLCAQCKRKDTNNND